MAGRDEGWTRADWARWFIEHDDVDEAARVLEPGDELTLGRSTFLDLAAALARRGMSASYQGQQARVNPGERMTGDLAASDRRPPARQTPRSTPAIKKLG
jgi:hypothetical protein